MNLKIMLEELARYHGGKTAIVLGESRLSYTDLDEASNRVANALIKMGVGRGERIAILVANSPEFVALYFGIAKIGAISVLLDTKYRASELDSLLSDSRPKVLAAESQFLKLLIPKLHRLKYIENVIELNPEGEGRFTSYQEIMATSPAQMIMAEPEPDDTATIAYTSGPAFRPRGIMLSHQDLVTHAIITGNRFRQTSEDVSMLFALPTHHVVGLMSVLLTSMARGSTVIMLPGLSLSGLMETIERERCTIFTGVPFIYVLLVRKAEEEAINYDLSSLRLCGTCGAPMPVDIMKRFKQLYGLDIIQFWGLTEATAPVTCQPIDGTGKPGSTGYVLPGWEIKIVADDGKEMPVNQAGEVLVRGPIMKGYYNNPQATAEVVRDRWLHTGDIGRIDEDGELFILGLKKELIIVKGQNIHPSDIESILRKHPKVAEAAVVGVPDELRGEVVRAVVSLKKGKTTGVEEIRRFCRKFMTNYKIPKQVIFLNSLPKTTTGETDKPQLKRLSPSS